MQDKAQTNATLDDLLAELKSQGAKRKDLWDRLASVSTFLSTVVLGAVGLYFTNSYNHQQTILAQFQAQQDQETKRYQAQIQEMEAVEKFIPYLTSNDERKKTVALITITALGSPRFAAVYATLNPSEGTQAAADRIMASAATSSQAAPAVSVASTTARVTTNGSVATAKPEKSGWVYLGQYVVQEQRWQTRYFDFSVSTEPTALISSTQTVRVQTGSINVRVGMPTESGQFPGVREVLNPGIKVKVKAVKEWSSTGYMWAEVEYQT